MQLQNETPLKYHRFVPVRVALDIDGGRQRSNMAGGGLHQHPKRGCITAELMFV